MDFTKLVSISGKSGLYLIINTRPNGLIVKSLTNNRTQFTPLRVHDYSLLDNISIYTDEDSEPLIKVFDTMRKMASEHPAPPEGTSEDDLRRHFRQVLPNYDEDKVYFSDIKKLYNWYRQLEKTDVSFEENGKSEEEE